MKRQENAVQAHTSLIPSTKENHPPETVAMTRLRHQGMEGIMEIKEKSFFLGLLKQSSIFQA